jgi:hypothetical protein
MDKLKGKLSKFKVIDKRNEHYGIVIEGRQWSGMDTMYDGKINGYIFAFHIAQLEPQ